MPTFQGTEAQRFLDAKTTGGHEYFRQAYDTIIIKDTIVVDDTMAVNDEILIGRELPGAVTIVPALSSVLVVTDPGTTLTLDFGVNGEVDNIGDGVSCATTGKKDLLAQEVESQSGTRIKATVTAASALNTGALIDVYLVARQTS